jgi:hypothetical protein
MRRLCKLVFINTAVDNLPRFLGHIPHTRTTRVRSDSNYVVAAHDCRILGQTCSRYCLPSLHLGGWHCAMLRYTAYIGVWNRPGGSYRWHTFGGGDHLALGDFWATLKLFTWWRRHNVPNVRLAVVCLPAIWLVDRLTRSYHRVRHLNIHDCQQEFCHVHQRPVQYYLRLIVKHCYKFQCLKGILVLHLRLSVRYGALV